MVRDPSSKPRKSTSRSKSNRVSKENEQQAVSLPDAIKVPVKPNFKVVFLHVGDDNKLPELMVKSVLKAMPGVEIVQLTDLHTKQVKGASSVVRKPFNGYLMTFRMEHLADLTGNWITFDTDIIVNDDLSHVFDTYFDVALTKRYGKILDERGKDIVQMMPYNTGVMFSRNPQFWKEAYRLLLKMPESAHKWWGDQLSVRLVADSKKYKMLELPCDTYNYSPKNLDDHKQCLVLHFKGARKEWILNGDYKL
jgi:lipopolysaccharide biosynthesis glycosyltransferase